MSHNEDNKSDNNLLEEEEELKYIKVNDDVELVVETMENDIQNINWIVNTHFYKTDIKKLSHRKLLSYQVYITNYFLKNNINIESPNCIAFFTKCVIWLCNTTLFQLLSNNQKILKNRKITKNNFPRSFYKLCPQKNCGDKNCNLDHTPYNYINTDINCIYNYIISTTYTEYQSSILTLNVEEIYKTIKTINYVFKYIMSYSL
jgi:hypothetical protein